IAAFPATGIPIRLSSADGAVRHLGDVKRSGAQMAEEVIEIHLNDRIRAVIPWAYSAQSNGAGSFHRYQVSMEVDNGAGEAVHIASVDASRDENVYTCIPGMIVNAEGGVRVHALELYSRRGSENRPQAEPAGRKGVFGRRAESCADGIDILMDRGPRNVFK
ncbi:MAG: TerD family protein, partial [Streptomycetaceae bacterium]|nr:TerD family protein [Streptomycetaceae bacterium]